MFNPLQFKKKKKRTVDPNAPPRPNLLSQDKKLREQTEAMDRLLRIVERQQDEIESLQTKYAQIQQSIEQIINVLRRR
jgi:predicted RNase H-like nuclease (RuvC/YqgF family)